MTLTFWQGKKKYYFLVLYLTDVAAFVAAIATASTLMGVTWYDPFSLRLYLLATVLLIILYTNHNLYSNKRNTFDDNDFMHILYANGMTAFLLCVFIFLFDPNDSALYLTILLTTGISALYTTIGRTGLDRIVTYARKKGLDVKKTIFFGDHDEELIQKLSDHHLGYRLIAITKDRNTLKKHLPKADIVFVNMKAIDDELLEIITKNSQVNWKIVSSLLNLVIEPVAFDEFKDYPIINISNNDATTSYLASKRVMDILLSGLAIVLLLPLGLVVAAIIKLTSPGPVFYTQERLGKHLKPFQLYKFRSMRVNADQEKAKLKNEVNGLFKMKDDPRIIPCGKFLRRTCIDELPQLLNIFKGDMSIVGPRPHLQRELANFKGWRRARFNVKPGLTGLWQVNGRHELNFDKAVLYDIYYVKHLSFLLDFTIILKTIPAIIMTRGRF